MMVENAVIKTTNKALSIALDENDWSLLSSVGSCLWASIAFMGIGLLALFHLAGGRK